MDMEIEKRIWDMRKKDYINIFLRFWVVIALISIIIGGAFFIYGYYDRIVKENYTSKIEYQLLYVVDTPGGILNPGETTGKLTEPTMYVNVYKKWYSDADVLKAVEKILSGYSDKEIQFNAGEIKRMTEITYLNFNLTVAVTTKNSSYSENVLKLLQQEAEPKIDIEVQSIKNRDESGDLEINKTIPTPAPGINYETEEEVMTSLIITFCIIFVGLFVFLYAAIVVLSNFDGRFKRHDVFENNYQIPALGEVVVKMYKE